MSGAAAARRRLCIVNPFQHGGGAEYQIDCLVNVLGPTGNYDISYLAHFVDRNFDNTYYRVVQIGNGGRTPRFGYLMDALPLYRALHRIKPDVIYQRVAGGYTGICAHYARLNKIRMIWHVAHDSDVSRDSSFHGRNPVRRLLEKRSIEYGIRHASCIVTQTRAQADMLAVNYRRQATVVIPNFHPAPMEQIAKEGPITVLWVANLKPAKRPEVFVRLAAALKDLAQVRFLVVGAAAGDEDPDWSRALMKALSDTANIQYLGRLSQNEVNQLIASSHVFVNTSDQEGFPNTFIQAWMRQVPVVSLTVNPDQVLDREAVGIHAGTEPALAAAVRALVTNPLLLREYAMRAQAYAIRYHSLRNADLLAELIGAGHANAAVDK